MANSNENFDLNITNTSSVPEIGLLLYWLLPLKVILSLVTAGLNLLIIVVIVFIIKIKNYSNLIFLSMSIADFMVGSISIPFYTIYTTFGNYWPLGYYVCIYWLVNDYTVTTVSLQSLLIISTHRFFLIKFPHKSNEKITNFRIAKIVSSWFVSCVFWGTSIILVSKNYFFQAEYCSIQDPFVFVLSIDIFGTIIPILFVILFNILTFFALRTKAKAKQKILNKKSGVTNINGIKRKSTGVQNINEEQLQTAQISNAITNASNIKNNKNTVSRLKNDKNAFLCIVCIVTTIFFNWLIYIVSSPLSFVCPQCVSAVLYEVGYWMTYSCSAINPIILIIFNGTFRAEIKNIFLKIKN